MTVEQLVEYPKATISTTIASDILGIPQHWFVVRAKEGKLSFRYEWSGRRLHINKSDVLQYCGYLADGTPIGG